MSPSSLPKTAGTGKDERGKARNASTL
jgi:hypothetical protein